MMEKLVQPQLRFPEFKGDWEEKTISKILSIGSGKDYKHLNEGNIPVYGTGGLMTYVNDYIYDGDSVGIGRKGTIDKPVFLTGKFWTVDTLFYTHKFSNSLPKFVFNLFQRINWQLYNEASGVPSLSKGTIEKIKINLPSLSEQQKIADYLTTIDRKIELLEEKKTQLTRYKKAMMQKLFAQEIRFKDDDGNNFPEWKEKRLGDVASFNVTKNKLNLELPVLTNSAEFGVMYQEDFFDNQIANDKNLDTYVVLDKYEFVYNPRISKLAPYGPININNLSKGLLSPLYSVFKISIDLMNLDFVSYYFKTSRWYKYMAISGNQGARSDRMAVNKETLRNIPICKPSLPEQQKIADFLSAIDTNINTVDEQIRETQNFKKAMLQQMFV